MYWERNERGARMPEPMKQESQDWETLWQGSSAYIEEKISFNSNAEMVKEYRAQENHHKTQNNNTYEWRQTYYVICWPWRKAKCEFIGSKTVDFQGGKWRVSNQAWRKRDIWAQSNWRPYTPMKPSWEMEGIPLLRSSEGWCSRWSSYMHPCINYL